LTAAVQQTVTLPRERERATGYNRTVLVD